MGAVVQQSFRPLLLPQCLHFVLSLLVVATVAADLADVKEGTSGVRNPKLFLVSSTTVTLSTTTLCYSSSTAAAACGKRKKRALVIASAAGDIAVTKSGASDSSYEADTEVTNGKNDEDDVSREGKFPC